VARLDADAHEIAICVLRAEVHYAADLPAGQPRYRLRGHFFWSPLAVADLVRAMRDFRPDIVHCYMNDANLFGRLAAARLRPPAKVITSVHLDDMSAGYRAAERLLQARSDRIVAHSRSIGDLLVGKLGVPASRVEVIVNGVDPARFVPADGPRRAAARARWEIPAGAVVALMPARIAEQKNQDLVVAAVARLRAAGRLPSPFQLLLAGRVSSPSLSRKVDRLIAGGDLGGQVRRLGAVKEIASLYDAADVVLMPSRTEASPIAALEALAAGVPVLISDTSNTDGVVVPGQHGWQVPANDAAALEAALAEIFATPPDERARRGRAGRAHVEAAFTNQRVAADFTRLYRTLVPDRA
jgi:glycosyltransferase involved in cell wall biosynthesis